MIEQKVASGAPLTDSMQQAVEAELGKDEQLVWTGRPQHGNVPGPGIKTVMILGVLPISVGVGFFIWAAADRQGDTRVGIAAFLTTLGLALLGLLLLTMRTNRRIHERSCYALTDRRAILWIPEAFGKVVVRSLFRKELRGLYRKELPDGSGDLILEEVTTPNPTGMPVTSVKGFHRIERVREVEQLVRDTLLRQQEA
jgi:hypothetical protein